MRDRRPKTVSDNSIETQTADGTPVNPSDQAQGTSVPGPNTKVIIIGSVIGGIVAIVLLLLFLILRRRRSSWPFYSFNFQRFNRQRHQSFGITALPLPESPLLQPTPFVIQRKSPSTVGRNPPLDVSPPPAEMGDRKERMPEDGVDTGAAGMEQQSDGQTHQNSTEIPQEQPNEQSRDPEVLAQKLDIVVQRLAQLEARFDEEAPPDYTSNRS
ncbi:hypothetical protein V5O48_011672 [Marasmius crinis-equi]|uniref:Uncharacterized protein n=1 Tax=Marasmius crinis-equi TaxID=585013 RepID=A0ABR3F523_9AGAR